MKDLNSKQNTRPNYCEEIFGLTSVIMLILNDCLSHLYFLKSKINVSVRF